MSDSQCKSQSRAREQQDPGNGGRESGRSWRGSMKEGCVRESVKGGVYERHRDREETLVPSVREDQDLCIQPAGWASSPGGSPESLSCWSPPDTLYPSPSSSGEKNPVATEAKGNNRQVGVSCSSLGTGHPSPASCWASGLLGPLQAPTPPPRPPDLGTAAAGEWRRGAAAAPG